MHESELPQHAPCWACQYPIDSSQGVIVDERMLPVCKKCWNEIPLAQRVLLAQRFSAAPRSDAMVEEARRLLAKLNLEFGGRMVDLLSPKGREN